MRTSGTGWSPEEVFARFNVSRESRERLRIYETLLRRWQRRINLVSEPSLRELWHRHIADGLQLDVLIGEPPQTIIDLGSGAGIPGLILALTRRGHDEVVLIEKNRKKAAFLCEVSRQAEIQVKVLPVAIENIDSDAYRSSKPVILARAVAPLGKLLELSAPLIASGRGLFHKGQRLDQELTQAAKSWKIRYNRHPSVIDSAGSILEVLEARQTDGHT
jgi:16S rRNA (guanine527-N7)-methyltransferase